MAYYYELVWQGLCDTCGGTVYTDTTWVTEKGHFEPEFDECPGVGCFGSIDLTETPPMTHSGEMFQRDTVEFGRRLYLALKLGRH